jgi:hypothetical protein
MAILGRGRAGRNDAVAWLASLALLAGGPLRAGPGALRPGWWQVVLAAVDRSWGGRLGPLLLAGAIGGALAAPHPLDRLAGLLPGGPPGRLARHRPKRGLGVGDVVGAAVVLDRGRGLPPCPPAARGVGQGSEFLAQVAGLVVFGGQAAGATLPGQLPDDLPVGRTEVGVGLQPAGPALLVLAQLPFAVVGSVGLLAGPPPPPRRRQRPGHRAEAAQAFRGPDAAVRPCW